MGLVPAGTTEDPIPAEGTCLCAKAEEDEEEAAADPLGPPDMAMDPVGSCGLAPRGPMGPGPGRPGPPGPAGVRAPLTMGAPGVAPPPPGC